MPDSEQLRRDKILAKHIVDIDKKHTYLIASVMVVKGLVEINKKHAERITNLPKGDKGDRGDTGPRGLAGKDGKNGVDGSNGKDGRNGMDGRDGKDGKTPVVEEEKIAKKAVEIIKDKQIIEIDHVKGLRGEISSYRNQMAMKQAGQHGGGDTVVAGSGITVTANANGTKTIAALGGAGGITVETPTGSVNGSNVTFTVTVAPKFIVTDTGFYIENFGYTRASLTITMDLAPNTFIRAYS